jgi:hypothetical protein
MPQQKNSGEVSSVSSQAEARSVREFEHALDSMALVLESTLPADHESLRSDISLYLGTLAPTAWICHEAMEVTLRLFPAPISPDRGVVLANRWISPPRGLDEPLVEVVHVLDAVIVHSSPRSLFAPSSAIIQYQGLGEIQNAASLEHDFIFPTRESWSNAIQVIDDDSEEEVSPAIQAARDVRTLSNLSATLLGVLFPVARETYQRWLSGALEPSAANLQRLFALRQLFDTVRDRVGDVRTWLLSPIPQREPDTPYDWLRQGRLTAVWEYVQGIARPSPYRLVKTGSGDYAIQVTSPVRGSDVRLEPEDVDEAEDWPEDEQ